MDVPSYVELLFRLAARKPKPKQPQPTPSKPDTQGGGYGSDCGVLFESSIDAVAAFLWGG